MKRFDQINVIPFIDIMLVLLAIVLTTATFIAQGRLDIDLPEADGERLAVQPQALELAIDRQSRLFVGTVPVTLAELETRLAAVSPDTPVVLRVDAEVPFARFVAVIDRLRAQELDRLSILTRDAR
jgi:biopolymer transport protein ExbD